MLSPKSLIENQLSGHTSKSTKIVKLRNTGCCCSLLFTQNFLRCFASLVIIPKQLLSEPPQELPVKALLSFLIIQLRNRFFVMSMEKRILPFYTLHAKFICTNLKKFTGIYFQNCFLFKPP